MVVDVSPAKSGGDLDRFSRGAHRTHVVEPQSIWKFNIHAINNVPKDARQKRSSHKYHQPSTQLFLIAP